MPEKIRTADLDRYEDRKRRIIDLLQGVREEADRLLDGPSLTPDDREELTVGVEMMRDSVSQFYTCTEALIQEADWIAPVITHLGDCLYAAFGSGSLCFRHIEISESAKKIVIKNKMDAPHRARSKGKSERQEIARPFILNASRDANGKVRSLTKLLKGINVALSKATDETTGKQSSISMDTLKRYIKELIAEADCSLH